MATGLWYNRQVFDYKPKATPRFDYDSIGPLYMPTFLALNRYYTIHYYVGQVW